MGGSEGERRGKGERKGDGGSKGRQEKQERRRGREEEKERVSEKPLFLALHLLCFLYGGRRTTSRSTIEYFPTLIGDKSPRSTARRNELRHTWG